MESSRLKQITIVNKLGLHARASAKWVQTASRYASHIELEYKGRCVNGKSIMGVMMLAASQGAVLTLRIEGPDAAEAQEALVQLVETRFGEAE